MLFTHSYTRTFNSPLAAESARQALLGLTDTERSRNILSPRNHGRGQRVRWFGSLHGETLYLFRRVGPGLLPPRFEVEVRAQVRPDNHSSTVSLRARPNRWYLLFSVWWTVVAVILLATLGTLHHFNSMSLFVTAFFVGMAIFQHIAIRQACLAELSFIASLLRE